MLNRRVKITSGSQSSGSWVLGAALCVWAVTSLGACSSSPAVVAGHLGEPCAVGSLCLGDLLCSDGICVERPADVGPTVFEDSGPQRDRGPQPDHGPQPDTLAPDLISADLRDDFGASCTKDAQCDDLG